MSTRFEIEVKKECIKNDHLKKNFHDLCMTILSSNVKSSVSSKVLKIVELTLNLIVHIKHIKFTY